MTSTTTPAPCCDPVLAGPLDPGDADVLAAGFRALSDPVRLRLLSLVGATTEVCACDLPDLVDRSQSTVSHHMKALVDAGLVRREQRGRWAWYRVDEDRVGALRDALADPAGA